MNQAFRAEHPDMMRQETSQTEPVLNEIPELRSHITDALDHQCKLLVVLRDRLEIYMGEPVPTACNEKDAIIPPCSEFGAALLENKYRINENSAIVQDLLERIRL